MDKLLVIGAGSFSGVDFVRHALTTEKYTVYAQSRTFKSNCFFSYDQKQATHIYCDLNKNAEAFFETIRRIEPAYIVNFAAQSEVPQSWDHPDHWYNTNTVFIAKLAKFLADAPYLKKYLHVSTPELYGTSDDLITESQPYNPSTPYAASKMAGDICLQLFQKQFGLPVLFIRSANVCGPTQQLWKIIPRSILKILKGDRVSLHGGGGSIRGFTDIRDVSRAENILLEDGLVGEIYHVSNHEFPTIREVVFKVYTELKERGMLSGFFEDYTEDVPQRPGNDKAYKLNYDKIKKLGWEPKISIDQSIYDTVSWILNNYTELSKLSDQYIHKA